MDFEENNLDEIEGLSQRGRTLSIVDLINANTIDIEMSAFCLYAISNGASFLTSAKPGNAGKTTLLACLLTFLTPNVRIVTTSSPSVVTEIHNALNGRKTDKLCVLCHEIGSGHWYGYLWGKYVGQFFNLMNYGCRIASCIHADTLDEIHETLVSRDLGVSENDFNRLDLILFMQLMRDGMGYKRRVSALYESDIKAGKHNLLFTWDEKSDSFIKHSDSVLIKRIAEKHNKSEMIIKNEIEHCKSFVDQIVKSSIVDFRQVRKKVVEFIGKNQMEL
ncbi:MAG: hypothetical protein ACPL7B_06155 [Candidatus Poribacteria bacterium]